MFVECSPSGWILAAYVEQQYPNQKWVPPSNEALQYFLSTAPRLGKDAKGRTCLLPDRSPVRRDGLADGEAPSQGTIKASTATINARPCHPTSSHLRNWTSTRSRPELARQTLSPDRASNLFADVR